MLIQTLYRYTLISSKMVLHRNYNAADPFCDFNAMYKVEIESCSVRWKCISTLKKKLFGYVEESFSLLKTYGRELVKANEGTLFTIEDIDGVFQRCFLMFRYAVSAFSHSRKLISIDGAHLHYPSRGTLLSATTVDGQGQLFPSA
ncbi:hypothetical protein GEMRC1_010442 [Eukaryota sp. GEM-RC1]